MKEKYISDRTLSLTKYPQYSSITSVSDAQQLKKKDGREYTLLGQSEKTYTPLQRTCLVIRTLALTLFSAGLALIFASIREDWKASLTGKRMVLIYSSNNPPKDNIPPNTTTTAGTAAATAQVGRVLQDPSKPLNTPSPSGSPEPSTIRSPLIPGSTQAKSDSKSSLNGSGDANNGSGGANADSAKPTSPLPSPNTKSPNGKNTGGSSIDSPSHTDTNRSQTNPDALDDSEIPGPSASTSSLGTKPKTTVYNELLQAQHLLEEEALDPSKMTEVINLLKAAQAKKSADAFLLLALLIVSDQSAAQIFFGADRLNVDKNIHSEELTLAREDQARNSALKKIETIRLEEFHRLCLEGAKLGNSYCAYIVGMLDYESLVEKPQLAESCSQHLKQALDSNIEEFVVSPPEFYPTSLKKQISNINTEEVIGIQKYTEALTTGDISQKIALLKESFFTYKNNLALIALMDPSIKKQLDVEEQERADEEFRSLSYIENDPKLAFMLGTFYEKNPNEGTSDPMDRYEPAYQNYEYAASRLKHIPSCIKLGDYHKSRNEWNQALEFYQKSALLGDSYSNLQVGRCHLNLAKELNQENHWYSKENFVLQQTQYLQKAYAHISIALLKDPGNPEAQKLLEDLYLSFPERIQDIASISSNKEDAYNYAWDIYQKHENLSSAQYGLGLMCESQLGSKAKAAQAEADTWYQKAAAGQHRVAIEALVRRGKEDILEQFVTNKNLPVIHIIRETDKSNELKWTQKAADAGDIEAMETVAFQFWDDKNQEKALFYWKQAAEKGSTEAIQQLNYKISENELMLYYKQGYQNNNPYLSLQYLLLYASGKDEQVPYTYEGSREFVERAKTLKAEIPEFIQKLYPYGVSAYQYSHDSNKIAINAEILSALGENNQQICLGTKLISFVTPEMIAEKKGQAKEIINRSFDYMLYGIKMENSPYPENISFILTKLSYSIVDYEEQITYRDKINAINELQPDSTLLSQEEALTRVLENSLDCAKKILYPDIYGAPSDTTMTHKEIFDNITKYHQLLLSKPKEI